MRRPARRVNLNLRAAARKSRRTGAGRARYRAPMRRLLVLFALLAALPASPALAWADKGHRLIATLAVEALPDDVPGFLARRRNLWTVGEVAREPDRSRGAGQPHDADLDPGHFIDVDDAGLVLGGPPLADLPANRSEYEKAVVAAGRATRDAGYLPYTLMDGYQQLVKDFAYWRAARAGERSAPRELRRRFRADRELRETLILVDLGHWGHFVGDGSNPLHVSVHYSGWGPFPNPEGYTNARIHAPFEDVFVAEHVDRAAVKAAMKPYAACGCAIKDGVQRYLLASSARLEPLYRLWTDGGFSGADPRGEAFAVERLAAGADQLRDWIVDAWRASGDMGVGYPAQTVKAIEAGQAIDPEAYFGRE